MLQLGLIIGWILTVFIGLLGAIILWKIMSGEIDLSYLISDENGWASLSRFQFLVFTFVVGLSLFFIIASQEPPQYPQIPNQILAILGISGGSYVLSKGIQTSRDVGMTEAGNPPPQSVDDSTEVKTTSTTLIGKEVTTKTGDDH